MDYQIIKGDAKHLDECVEILLDSHLGRTYFSRQSPRGMIEKAIKKEELVVVLLNSKCVGFLFFEINGTFDKYPYLHVIVVDERYQKQGIGRALITNFEQVLTRDYDHLFLLVGDNNAQAKRFYEQQGYVSVGRLPNFYVDGVDEILMMKMKPFAKGCH